MSWTALRRDRRFYLALFVVALVIAGVVSYYASGSPDGLEHVASTTGFADSAGTHASDGSPLADYGVKGVDNARLSGGLAGIIGVLVTLALASGVTFVVRRRARSNAAA
ncbi:PDGLE domain-containing protein [Nocardioides sp.]|uniref:PDGLE domain-containing protein n=1 Tax=Nocardioides sp. TaxID=35761 RepID=UPI002631EB25|nr:PDGLE domain-containing protein [Nocardioides sp.]